MVLVATQVKRRRGTTAENDAFTGAEGEITVDTEKHELRVHDGVTQGGFKIGGGSGSGRNIGDIFYTSRTDTNLAGAVECDGATYDTTDFTGDGSIGELLEAGKLDYISLSAYSTAIAQTGWCDKIGWDGTGTTAFRVPTLNAHIVQTNNIPVKGNGMTLGLSETDNSHAGLYASGSTATGLSTVTGAYGKNYNTITTGTTFAGKSIGVTKDSTKSGIIADTSDTAQLRVMIQIANGATDQALETCTGVLADVAGLKDMSNITETGKETVVGWGMPDYSAGITTGYNTAFTAPTDGLGVWAFSGNYTQIHIRLGNTTSSPNIALQAVDINSPNACACISLPLKKGETYYIQFLNTIANVHSNTFYPFKGVNQ